VQPQRVLNPTKHGSWLMSKRTEFGIKDKESHVVSKSQVKQLRWPTQITAEMVSAAVLRPDRMSTIALFEYIRHLRANDQSAQRYEIEFWKKVFYPLGCLVMVVLALPFAYLHFRDEGISAYVFVGVLAGISFFFLNNVFGYLGELRQWQPWLAAALPGLIYSFLIVDCIQLARLQEVNQTCVRAFPSALPFFLAMAHVIPCGTSRCRRWQSASARSTVIPRFDVPIWN